MGYGYYTRYIGGVERHLGYAVKCLCDSPGCEEVIDRGLDYLCGEDPGDDNDIGCGRYFCSKHRGFPVAEGRGQSRRHFWVCQQCAAGVLPYPMKPDLPDALEDVVFRAGGDQT